MGLLSRQTPLERKRRKLEKELTTIQEDLRAVKDRPDDPHSFLESVDALSADRVPPEADAADAMRRDEEERVVRERSRRINDDRFARYFSNSFERARPLRHERRIQRNKAILMSVFVFALLVWAVFRFLR